MTADEPAIFENLTPYMQTRLMLASAVIFRESKMQAWTHGHEKLVGVILWNFESKKENAFKYSRVLKRYAYGRTQNYKLLKPIVDNKILEARATAVTPSAQNTRNSSNKYSRE